jgi:hypothetical protein
MFSLGAAGFSRDLEILRGGREVICIIFFIKKLVFFETVSWFIAKKNLGGGCVTYCVS